MSHTPGPGGKLFLLLWLRRVLSATFFFNG